MSNNDESKDCFNKGIICLITGQLIVPSVDCLNCDNKNKEFEDVPLNA